MPRKTNETAYFIEGQSGVTVRIYAASDEEAVRYGKDVLGKKLEVITTVMDARAEKYRVVWNSSRYDVSI